MFLLSGCRAPEMLGLCLDVGHFLLLEQKNKPCESPCSRRFLFIEKKGLSRK